MKSKIQIFTKSKVLILQESFYHKLPKFKEEHPLLIFSKQYEKFESKIPTRYRINVKKGHIHDQIFSDYIKAEKALKADAIKTIVINCMIDFGHAKRQYLKKL